MITALVIGDAELLGALNLPNALQATMVGFYLIDTVEADIDDLDPAAKADALAHTIQHAFEPAGDPDPEALAATESELCASWEDLIGIYRKWIYSSGPAMFRE